MLYELDILSHELLSKDITRNRLGRILTFQIPGFIPTSVADAISCRLLSLLVPLNAFRVCFRFVFFVWAFV